MNKTFTLIKRDLFLVFYRQLYFLKPLFLFIIITTLTNLMFNNIEFIHSNILLSLAITSATAGHICGEQQQNTHFEQLIVSGNGYTPIITSKMIVMASILLICFLSGIFFNFLLYGTQQFNLYHFFVYTLLLLNISVISTTIALIARNSSKLEIMNIIITLPVLISYLVFGISLLNTESIAELVNGSKILLGLFLVYTPILVWGCGKCLSRI